MVQLRISLFVCCLLAGLSATSYAQSIRWESSLERATQLASEQNKLLWLHFTADWSRPCQQIETFVFRNSIVQGTINDNLIPVKVDVDRNPLLAKEFGVSAVPFDVATTPGGRILLNRRSPLDATGYQRMIEQLVRDHHSAGQDSTVQRELQQLRDKLNPRTNALPKQGFQPDPPSHQMPKISYESARLASKNRIDSSGVQVVKNPFFKSNRTASNTAPSSDFQVQSIDPKDGSHPLVADNQSPTGNQHRSAPLKIVNPLYGTGNSNRVAQKPSVPPIVTPTDHDDTSQFVPRIVSPPQSSDAPPTRTAREFTPVRDGTFRPTDKPANRLDDDTEWNTPTLNNKHPIVDTKPTSPETSPPAINEPEASQPVITAVPKVALQGKCPVTLLVDGQWVNGDKQFGCTHRGRTYLFQSETKLNQFKKSPDQYSPLLAGFDPVAFHETGKLLDGVEHFGIFMEQPDDQRIVLFANAENRDKFKNNPLPFIDSVRVAIATADDQRTIR